MSGIKAAIFGGVIIDGRFYREPARDRFVWYRGRRVKLAYK